MSLVAFQTALADLVASPTMCLAVRDKPDHALADYDLDARERRRLVAVVWQRGMSANCTVYRATRVTPLYTLLPLTVAALGEAMTAELDDYWAATARMDVHFDIEISRFAAHLRARLESGVVRTPHDPRTIADVLAIEIAGELLRLTPAGQGPKERTLELTHEPIALLGAVSTDPVDFTTVPFGRYVLIIRKNGRSLQYLLASDGR
jgi:hypothetical protein